MRITAIVAIGMGLLGLAQPASALGLGEAAEAEAARHNARAGGPTNYRDAELLQRYGCFSSTDSAFCRKLEHKRRAQARSLRRDW